MMLINGNIVEKYEYDVFGEVTIRDANDQTLNTSDYGNPYMFTGRRYDNETGLYYYRARYYNPYIGRFLQPDPIGYDDGMNLYVYCQNNAVNRGDPFGLESLCRRCADRIFDDVRTRFPNDSFKRHCTASCEISEQCPGGSLCAWVAGWANECAPGRDFALDDLGANTEGRKCSGSSVGCEQCCQNRSNDWGKPPRPDWVWSDGIYYSKRGKR